MHEKDVREMLIRNIIAIVWLLFDCTFVVYIHFSMVKNNYKATGENSEQFAQKTFYIINHSWNRKGMGNVNVLFCSKAVDGMS